MEWVMASLTAALVLTTVALAVFTAFYWQATLKQNTLLQTQSDLQQKHNTLLKTQINANILMARQQLCVERIKVQKTGMSPNTVVKELTTLIEEVENYHTSVQSPWKNNKNG
ncbi:hypothetical protein LCGC14_1976190 [marine sediment metagenome]|uniref:Uncharacterized protein n=1 Tax=marine sediment metagenome TaxID=412755 RepID=A0A0F9HNQ2_9ZZZZ